MVTNSQLLNNLETDWSRDKFYADPESNKTHLGRSVDEVHDFKIYLKKLRAHLVKHGSNPQKRQVIVDKLAKSHKNWDNSMKKSLKSSIASYKKFSKVCVKPLNEFQLDSVYVNKINPEKLPYLEKAIGSHIARYNANSGESNNSSEDMVEYLKNVYNISEETSTPYIQMTQIIEEMKIGNLSPCLEWCRASNLELLYFQLHYLHAMSLLSQKKSMDCYVYIQKNLAPCVREAANTSLSKPVSVLLAKIVIGETVSTEKVQSFSEICVESFTRQYCIKNKLPFNSALFLVVLSGIIAFQVFTKYETLRKVSHVDWTTADELPFHVALPEFLTSYHPIFMCPVLKEETTLDNPPFSLPCHHVLSKKSLDKLSKSGTCNFKCPYCPVMSTKQKTRKVNFVKLR